MVPRLPECRVIDPGDRGLFERHAELSPRSVCECSFANLMIWRDFDRPQMTFINGNMCIRIDPLVGRPFFLEPLGNDDLPATVESCLAHTGAVSMASSSLISSVGGNGFRIRPLPEHFDYIYRTRDLAELKGRRFDGKRNHIKRMLRHHPDAAYVELTKGDAPAALDLFDAWCAVKRGSESEDEQLPDLAYTCQRDAVARAFEYFEELRLVGGMLVIDGAMAGFIAGSRLRDDMACVHLCYARPGVPGVFPTLVWEACRKTFARFEFVNLEQDMGLAGLRKNKLSFCPVKIEEKFEITEVAR